MSLIWQHFPLKLSASPAATLSNNLKTKLLRVARLNYVAFLLSPGEKYGGKMAPLVQISEDLFLSMMIHSPS